MLPCLLALTFAAPAPADDTAAFLKADNWHGLQEYWTLDPEKKTLTGKTEKDPKYNTFFVSKAEYGDFELSFQVKLTGGIGNSGVQFRSKLTDEKKFIVAGPQADIGQQHWGGLYGEGVGGMMQAADAEKVKKIVKPDDWNDYVLSAAGSHVTIKVNSETMVDGDFPATPNKKDLSKTGVIAFQLHAGPPMTVEYRNFSFTKK